MTDRTSLTRFLGAATIAALFVTSAFAADAPAKKEPAAPKSAAAAPAPKAAEAKPAAAPAPATDEKKVIYALGLAISQNLAVFGLTEADLVSLQSGIADGVLGKAKFNAAEDGPKIQALAQARSAVAAEAEKKVGEAYLEKAAAEAGAKKTASGLVYKELKVGTGDSPKATDKVKVDYHGTLIDGTVFDSTVVKGEPLVHPVNQFVPCWTEALQLMKVGGKIHLTCPSALAYGDRGSPPAIKPGATIVFDLELLGIEK
jgi:FKBP-type peptidyl-prolyl cis-trans isomerase FkpA/FKBP-type peptidyl-prolyl cis-trans isomerase FklB